MPAPAKMEIMPASAELPAGPEEPTEPRNDAPSLAGNYPNPERAVTVLAISPHQEDHVRLRHIFTHSNWHVHGVSNWREAQARLLESATPVVLCEVRLTDATWKEVLDGLGRMPDPPLLIVTSRWADDELWAEVLNLGGYDVLMKPLDQAEVVRVVGLAWLNWKRLRAAARGNRLAAG